MISIESPWPALSGADTTVTRTNELYGQAPAGPVMLGTFRPYLYSSSMSEPLDHPRESVQAEIDRIRSELDVARAAAATAEREQGRLQGELTKVTELWVAACHHREQWDVLFAENVEELRLANEQVEIARRRRREIEESTTWRLVQAGLAPYRRVRGIR